MPLIDLRQRCNEFESGHAIEHRDLRGHCFKARGQLLRGVRFFGGGSRTSTLFMSLRRKIIRVVDTIRREDPAIPVRLS